VAYAQPLRAVVKCYRAPRNATIGAVLEMAAGDPDFSGIDLKSAVVGVFGRIAASNQAVNDGDRIEIYRPLAADPKSARRARVRAARRQR
jgi:putative ubiquitin-RnfH superfamily antitoxin RatB of RatAB toxin-antitoxin module